MILNTEQNKEQIFKRLFEEYYAPFCIYAKRYIDDPNIRQDIVSEAFASLWENINTFDIDNKTIIGYIKVCVKNRCINYLKHLNHQMDFAEQNLLQTPIYETDPDSIYTKEEMYKMLYDALEHLPSNYKKVFIESFFGNKTREEIAFEMNISIKTAGRYKQKALELLRKELKDLFYIIILISIDP